MKIAILGLTPSNFETALRLQELGAAVDVYDQFLGPHLNANYWQHFRGKTMNDAVTPFGLELLEAKGHRLLDLTAPFHPHAYQEQYFYPLLEITGLKNSFKNFMVKRVHKRFLHREEKTGKDRFRDLFRVVVEIDPGPMIEESLKNSPEQYKNLSAETIESLRTRLENYNDYDIVIESYNPYAYPLQAGISGLPAMGEEQALVRPYLFYGAAGLDQFTSKLAEKKWSQVLVIGDHDLAKDLFQNLIASGEHLATTLFHWSTHNSQVFDHLPSWQKLDEYFRHDYQTYETKNMEWRELDDFVQVKIPKPTEPYPPMLFHLGHDVVSFHRLIDSETCYVTIEDYPERTMAKLPQVHSAFFTPTGAKTLSVDAVLVLTGHHHHFKAAWNEAMQAPLTTAPFADEANTEMGRFQLLPFDLTLAAAVETKLLTYFSPKHH